MFFMSSLTQHKARVNKSLKGEMNIVSGFHLGTCKLLPAFTSGLKTQTKHFHSAVSLLLPLSHWGK